MSTEVAGDPLQNPTPQAGYFWGSRLLDDLPRLLTSPTGGIDFDASEAAVVLRVGEAAENMMCVIHQGIRAIGLLMADYSPTTTADLMTRGEVINDLGALLAHLGDIGTNLTITAAFARNATADYLPPTAN